MVKRCILTTKWHYVRKKDMGVSLPPLLRGGALLGLDGRDCGVVYHTQCAEGGEDEDPREVCDEEQVACEKRLQPSLLQCLLPPRCLSRACLGKTTRSFSVSITNLAWQKRFRCVRSRTEEVDEINKKPEHDHVLSENAAPFSQLFLCLSRACLGKNNHF